ncbi:hypothetical protein IAT40_007720 [Kwoniella sp. CBS 6097]
MDIQTPDFGIHLPLPSTEADGILWPLPPTPLTPLHLNRSLCSAFDAQQGIDPRALSSSPATAHRQHPFPTTYSFGSNPLLDFHSLSSPPPPPSASLPLEAAAFINNYSSVPQASFPFFSSLDVQVEDITEQALPPSDLDNEKEEGDSKSESESDFDSDDESTTPHRNDPVLTSASVERSIAIDQQVIDPSLRLDPPIPLIQLPTLVHEPNKSMHVMKSATTATAKPKKSATVKKERQIKKEGATKKGALKKAVQDKKQVAANKASAIKKTETIKKVTDNKPRSARLDLLARQKGSKKGKAKAPPKSKAAGLKLTVTAKPTKKPIVPALPVPSAEDMSLFLKRRKIAAFPPKTAPTPTLRPMTSGKAPRKTIAVPTCIQIKAPSAPIASAPPSPSPSSEASDRESDYAPSPSPVPTLDEGLEDFKPVVTAKRRRKPQDSDDDDEEWSEGLSSKKSKGNQAGKGQASGKPKKKAGKRFGTGRRDQNQRAQAKYRNKVKDRGTLTTRFLGQVFQLFAHGKATPGALKQGVNGLREAYLKELEELDPGFASNFAEEYLKH